MGMFDYVNIKVKCPECNEEVNNFQSKDSGCMLKTLEFWEVDSFYAACEKCKAWIQFEIKESVREKLPIYAYEMFVSKRESRDENREVNPSKYIVKEDK